MLKASHTSMIVGLFGLLVPALAQSQRSSGGQVPSEHRPPAGMCRIWVDGVPAGKQPAATDCATAIRTRPSNGRVLFGDERPDSRTTRETLIPKPWQPRRSEPRTEPRSEPERREPSRTEPRSEPQRREPSRTEPQPTRAEPRRSEPRRDSRRSEERRRSEKPTEERRP